MLKAGIFLDAENLSRNGGWGIRYEIIKDLVEAQGTRMLRANAYLAIDVDREIQDHQYRIRNSNYRDAIRRTGFHLVLKEVRRYVDSAGELVVKANADLDLAVDALLQSDNLDYILLGSGDGDFLRLVRALQNRGKRVDLLSFANTSNDLIREVDNHFSGFLIPGLIGNEDSDRNRGIMHAFNEERGFGFITMRTGLGLHDSRHDIFCHIKDVLKDEKPTTDTAYVAHLKHQKIILEFDIEDTDDGLKATNISEFKWKK
ncbi:MAG: NYN domain-containing protein [Desulforegulaceae bacterium]|nr:NYN domain-containing protein [Desulforegulaceae bacterium]